MSEQDIIDSAVRILNERLCRERYEINSPENARTYLYITNATMDHEEFGVLWLDVDMRLIADEKIAKGSLTECQIYHRNLVKSGLMHNAKAAVLYHNHPGRSHKPSDGDIRTTEAAQRLLATVEIHVIDHIIVSQSGTFSFHESKMI